MTILFFVSTIVCLFFYLAAFSARTGTAANARYGNDGVPVGKTKNDDDANVKKIDENTTVVLQHVVDICKRRSWGQKRSGRCHTVKLYSMGPRRKGNAPLREIIET